MASASNSSLFKKIFYSFLLYTAPSTSVCHSGEVWAGKRKKRFHAEAVIQSVNWFQNHSRKCLCFFFSLTLRGNEKWQDLLFPDKERQLFVSLNSVSQNGFQTWQVFTVVEKSIETSTEMCSSHFCSIIHCSTVHPYAPYVIIALPKKKKKRLNTLLLCHSIAIPEALE